MGVDGLIAAYKTTAQMAISASEIIDKTIDIHFIIKFEYKNTNKVMKIIKEKSITIVSQKMTENCQIEIDTRKKNVKSIFDIFNDFFLRLKLQK